MGGVGLRFVISLVSIAAALIAGNSWVATGVIVGIFALSAIIEPVVWERFTDAETRRRDLEDRVHIRLCSRLR